MNDPGVNSGVSNSHSALVSCSAYVLKDPPRLRRIPLVKGDKVRQELICTVPLSKGDTAKPRGILVGEDYPGVNSEEFFRLKVFENTISLIKKIEITITGSLNKLWWITPPNEDGIYPDSMYGLID